MQRSLLLPAEPAHDRGGQQTGALICSSFQTWLIAKHLGPSPSSSSLFLNSGSLKTFPGNWSSIIIPWFSSSRNYDQRKWGHISMNSDGESGIQFLTLKPVPHTLVTQQKLPSCQETSSSSISWEKWSLFQLLQPIPGKDLTIISSCEHPHTSLPGTSWSYWAPFLRDTTANSSQMSAAGRKVVRGQSSLYSLMSLFPNTIIWAL